MNKAIAIFKKNLEHWKNQLNVKECKKPIAYVSVALSRRAKGADAWLLAILICGVVRA